MQVSLNTRIDHELAEKLDTYSKETKIPKAQIVAESLKDYFKKVEGSQTKQSKPGD